MSRTEHIKDMLKSADRINQIIAEMKQRKAEMLASKLPMAA
ncbi:MULTISPECIES: hypothetical protein [Escherichia]|jgi:hypothetical protein|nr:MULTISPECIES: hypothetical protein [Escherichia]KDU35415.1 hypothetical protein AC86_3794 [Escherichia coli 3-073-06_S4_C1]KDZ78398.1 hypothetical protein AD42_4818 [Escherichia coli 3-073-06_S4_C3]KEN29961.1 hypothetical protein AC23_0278 [Escherichia coli 7-233-03_S3_C2]MCV5072467.1 hypothetical protein [Escherichia coli]MCV5866086.1 hypothetical protein [Escherichia coli]